MAFSSKVSIHERAHIVGTSGKVALVPQYTMQRDVSQIKTLVPDARKCLATVIAQVAQKSNKSGLARQRPHELSVPRCMTRLTRYAGRRGNDMVSATLGIAKTSADDTCGQRACRCKAINEEAGIGCRERVVPPVSATGAGIAGRTDGDTRGCVNSGFDAASRERALPALECTSPSTGGSVAQAMNISDAQTNAVELQTVTNEGEMKEKPQAAHVSPLTCRSREESSALVSTTRKTQTADYPTFAKGGKENEPSSNRKQLASPSMHTRQSAANFQNARFFAHLITTPPSSSSGKEWDQNPEGSCITCEQRSGAFCQSSFPLPQTTQSAFDALLTTTTDNREDSLESDNVLTLLPDSPCAVTSVTCGVSSHDAVCDMYDARSSLPKTEDHELQFTPINERVSTTRKWTACKPFPKKETLLSANVRPAPSSLINAAAQTIPGLETSQAPPLVAFELRKECLAYHHTVGFHGFICVADSNRERGLSTADTAKVATLNETRGLLSAQKDQLPKDQSDSPGFRALRPAADSAARIVVLPNTGKTVAPTGDCRNQGTFKACALPMSQFPALSKHALSACALWTSSQQLTRSPNKTNLFYISPCVSKAESSLDAEQPALAKSIQVRRSSESHLSMTGHDVRARIHVDAYSDNKVSQLQPQPRLRTSIISREPSLVTRAQADKAPFLLLTNAAASNAVPPVPNPWHKTDESKAPLDEAKEAPGSKRIRTKAANKDALTLTLPELGDLSWSRTACARVGDTVYKRSCFLRESKAEDQQSQWSQSPRNIPEKKLGKRSSQVPPLPLHLLPEILARKDAEERKARRRERVYTCGEEDVDIFAWSMTNAPYPNSPAPLDGETYNFAAKRPTRKLKQQCGEWQTTYTSVGRPVLRLGVPLLIQELSKKPGSPPALPEASAHAATGHLPGSSPKKNQKDSSKEKRLFAQWWSVKRDNTPSPPVQNKSISRIIRTEHALVPLPPLACAELNVLVTYARQVREKPGTQEGVNDRGTQPRCFAQSDWQQTQYTPRLLRLTKSSQISFTEWDPHRWTYPVAGIQRAAFQTVEEPYTDGKSRRRRTIEKVLRRAASLASEEPCEILSQPFFRSGPLGESPNTQKRTESDELQLPQTNDKLLETLTHIPPRAVTNLTPVKALDTPLINHSQEHPLHITTGASSVALVEEERPRSGAERLQQLRQASLKQMQGRGAAVPTLQLQALRSAAYNNVNQATSVKQERLAPCSLRIGALRQTNISQLKVSRPVPQTQAETNCPQKGFKIPQRYQEKFGKELTAEEAVPTCNNRREHSQQRQGRKPLSFLSKTLCENSNLRKARTSLQTEKQLHMMPSLRRPAEGKTVEKHVQSAEPAFIVDQKQQSSVLGSEVQERGTSLQRERHLPVVPFVRRATAGTTVEKHVRKAVPVLSVNKNQYDPVLGCKVQGAGTSLRSENQPQLMRSLRTRGEETIAERRIQSAVPALKADKSPRNFVLGSKAQGAGTSLRRVKQPLLLPSLRKANGETTAEKNVRSAAPGLSVNKSQQNPLHRSGVQGVRTYLQREKQLQMMPFIRKAAGGTMAERHVQSMASATRANKSQQNSVLGSEMQWTTTSLQKKKQLQMMPSLRKAGAATNVEKRVRSAVPTLSVNESPQNPLHGSKAQAAETMLRRGMMPSSRRAGGWTRVEKYVQSAARELSSNNSQQKPVRGSKAQGAESSLPRETLLQRMPSLREAGRETTVEKVVQGVVPELSVKKSQQNPVHDSKAQSAKTSLQRKKQLQIMPSLRNADVANTVEKHVRSAVPASRVTNGQQCPALGNRNRPLYSNLDVSSIPPTLQSSFKKSSGSSGKTQLLVSTVDQIQQVKSKADVHGFTRQVVRPSVFHTRSILRTRDGGTAQREKGNVHLGELQAKEENYSHPMSDGRERAASFTAPPAYARRTEIRQLTTEGRFQRVKRKHASTEQSLVTAQELPCAPRTFSRNRLPNLINGSQCGSIVSVGVPSLVSVASSYAAADDRFFRLAEDKKNLSWSFTAPPACARRTERCQLSTKVHTRSLKREDASKEPALRIAQENSCASRRLYRKRLPDQTADSHCSRLASLNVPSVVPANPSCAAGDARFFRPGGDGKILSGVFCASAAAHFHETSGTRRRQQRRSAHSGVSHTPFSPATDGLRDLQPRLQMIQTLRACRASTGANVSGSAGSIVLHSGSHGRRRHIFEKTVKGCPPDKQQLQQQQQHQGPSSDSSSCTVAFGQPADKVLPFNQQDPPYRVFHGVGLYSEKNPPKQDTQGGSASRGDTSFSALGSRRILVTSSMIHSTAGTSGVEPTAPERKPYVTHGLNIASTLARNQGTSTHSHRHHPHDFLPLSLALVFLS